MKSIGLILLLFSFSFVHAQTLDDDAHEEIVNFTSILVDYEIHNGKVVALTKRNREYFVYYEDSKGAKLHQSFDIFFPTDVEIDCMGNLFVVGLDSAIQIEITDHVKRIQELDLETYEANIRSCRALFEKTLVRTGDMNSLIYEPIDDSVYQLHPIIGVVQVWSDQVKRTNADLSNRTTTREPALTENRSLNIKNDVYSSPMPGHRRRTSYISKRDRTSELSAFQVGDSLWVVDETDEILLIYDDFAGRVEINGIDGLELDFRIEQDRQTQKVYFTSVSAGKCTIKEVDQYGELSNGVTFQKGFLRSSLKISGGYLYFRDSKGVGESIKRVRLH